MKIALVFLIALGHLLYAGVALTLCWEWFVHPLGLPLIGLAHAVGIMLVAKFVAGHVDLESSSSCRSGSHRSEGDLWFAIVFKPLVQTTVVILMGAAAHAMM